MTSQLNVRIPGYTKEQLDYLMHEKGLTQTQAVIIAIDHLYKSTIQGKRTREEQNNERNRQAND